MVLSLSPVFILGGDCHQLNKHNYFQIVQHLS